MAVGLPDEMFDPMRQRFFITCVPRIGHFANDKQLHLLIEIEWTPELQPLGFFRAHAIAKIGEIFSTYPQRCAGHDTGAPLAEKHLPQCRGDIDRRGIER